MKFAALLSIAACTTVACAQTSPSPDEAAVRAVIIHEIRGWAEYSPHMVAENYTEDAIWLNPFGVHLRGGAELEKFLVRLFSQSGYRAAKDTIPPKIIAVRFESSMVATVWSEETSAGQVSDVSGKPMGDRHSWYLEVLVKRDGVWKIRESIISDEKNP